MTKRKILFITGTRADYGKIKSLIHSVEKSEEFKAFIYVSGMHLLPQYGNTYREVLKDRYENIYVSFGQKYTHNMSYNLGEILTQMSSYVENIEPDMIVVHGDRSDALAGALVGALNNILVAHIEGGEITGTIDDSIRHAITKFAHLHFVCNEEAKKRLMQLGENENNIYLIGSPDIDIMLHKKLPELDFVKKYYEVPFKKYALFLFHPITTEYDLLGSQIENVVKAMKESGKDYIAIYPNNDLGTEIILQEIQGLKKSKHFRVFPSIRFEYFLTLLKHAEFIIGNSSAGIRESGIYGIPSIDIGTRQKGRYDIKVLKNIQHVKAKKDEILHAIDNVGDYRIQNRMFGEGNSTEKFLEIIKDESIWQCGLQKRFMDL